jgi:hypothetical protein
MFSAILEIVILNSLNERVHEGSPSNIKKNILRKTHANFGPFVRPVTVISLSHYTIPQIV